MAIIRDMPMSEYLSNGNAGNHQLKDFSVSPRLYFDKYVAHAAVLDADDDEGEEDAGGGKAKAAATKARVFGLAFEMFMDDPRLFDQTYIQVPLLEPDGKPFKLSKKLGIAWKEEQLAAKRTWLSAKEFAAARAMKEAFLENEDAVDLLSHCERQVTLTCVWPPPVESSPNAPLVTLQSRPDYVSLKGCARSQFRPFTVDLKTVDHMERMYSRRVMVEYGYDNQAEVARTCMSENGYEGTVHYILACEKASPNRCEVFEMDREFLEACSGWLYKNSVELAECLELNVWPRSRTPGIRMALKPAWKMEDSQ